MLIIDALVILGLIAGIVFLTTTVARNRMKLRLEREAREHQVRILTASKEVAQLLLLDDDVAIGVYRKLEEDLRKKGKLPNP